MNASTSSRFNFLNMNTKVDFVVEPYKLLESACVHIFDVNDFIENLTDLVANFVESPARGAYYKNDFKPFILASEVLYTHKDTFEFFPEIKEPIMDRYFRKTKTVGTRITWMQAFENPINVYNSEGRLLLKPDSNRNNFYFGSTPLLYRTKVILDLIKLVVMTEVKWGDTAEVLNEVKSYLKDERTLDFFIDTGLAVIRELVETVREIVRKNPWLIYTVNNFKNQILLETNCDWRHYQCNLTLWEQQHPEVSYEDPLLPWSYKDSNHSVNYSSLEDFFNLVFSKTGYKINDIKDLYALLEKTKGNKKLTEEFLSCIEIIEKLNDNNPSANLVSKLIRRPYEFHNTSFYKDSGIFIL